MSGSRVIFSHFCGSQYLSWNMPVLLTMDYETSQQDEQLVFLVHQPPDFFFCESKLIFS